MMIFAFDADLLLFVEAAARTWGRASEQAVMVLAIARAHEI